jgi:hypothetical protein
LTEVENLVIETINPQLITGIKGGLDTDIEFISNESADLSLTIENSTTSEEAFNEYHELITISQTPKYSNKKRNQLVDSSFTNCTQTFVEDVIKLEKEKLELKKKKLHLIRIDLKLKAKELESRGIKVSQELEEISQFYNEL